MSNIQKSRVFSINIKLNIFVKLLITLLKLPVVPYSVGLGELKAESLILSGLKRVEIFEPRRGLSLRRVE